MRSLLQDALRGHRQRYQSALVAYLGLTLALTVSLLVGLLAIALSQPDPAIPAPERVVVLDFKGNPPGHPSDWFTASPVFFGPALQARGAPLDDIARVQTTNLTLRLEGGSLKVFATVLADPALVPLMGLRALHGDLPGSLQQPDAVVLTPEAVSLLWGALPPAQAVGRQLSTQGKSYRVGAVMAGFGPQHPLYGNLILAGFNNQANINSQEDRDALYMVNGRVFARLRAGVSAEQVGPWMREAFRAHPAYATLPGDWVKNREPAYFRALPLPQLRLEGGENETRWTMLAALGIACGLLLIMAVINALNLQLAQVLQRQRETALRRALGASRWQLLQLWAAELGVALLSVGALACLLSWFIAPALLGGLGLPPDTPMFGPDAAWAVLALAAVLLVLLLILLLAPAALALRRAPAQALQGRTESEGPWGRRLRQGLLTLQLAGALVLLALTGLVASQHHYLLHADRGFALENRLLLDAWAQPDDAPRFVPLVEELTHHPAVTQWAFSTMVPPWGMQGTMENYRRAGSNGGQTLRVATVSPGFFDTYGMQLLAGDPRLPLHGEVGVVLDARASQLLGFASPQAALGQLVLGGGEMLQAGQQAQRVLAVIANVRLETARDLPQPRAFVISDHYSPFLTLYGPDPAKLRATVETLWRKHQLPFFYLLDDVSVQTQVAYQQEALLAGLLGTLALLAVAVAVAGAYALVADTLRRRRTELVLRRLHGAGNADVVRHVGAEFAGPMLLAGLLSVPLAAALGQRYLADFVDKVSMVEGLVLPLLAAAALTVLVVALAALRHVRLALGLRPIEALR